MDVVVKIIADFKNRCSFVKEMRNWKRHRNAKHFYQKCTATYGVSWYGAMAVLVFHLCDSGLRHISTRVLCELLIWYVYMLFSLVPRRENSVLIDWERRGEIKLRNVRRKFGTSFCPSYQDITKYFPILKQPNLTLIRILSHDTIVPPGSMRSRIRLVLHCISLLIFDLPISQLVPFVPLAHWHS